MGFWFSRCKHCCLLHFKLKPELKITKKIDHCLVTEAQSEFFSASFSIAMMTGSKLVPATEKWILPNTDYSEGSLNAALQSSTPRSHQEEKQLLWPRGCWQTCQGNRIHCQNSTIIPFFPFSPAIIQTQPFSPQSEVISFPAPESPNRLRSSWDSKSSSRKFFQALNPSKSTQQNKPRYFPQVVLLLQPLLPEVALSQTVGVTVENGQSGKLGNCWLC